MSGNPTKLSARRQRIAPRLDEHAGLRIALGKLRRLSSALGDKRVPASGRVRELITDFGERLRGHFAAEEADGYFGDLVVRAPLLAEHVAAFLAEHREIGASLEELDSLAQTEGHEREIARLVRVLVSRVAAHEHAENVFIQDVYLQDDGEGG
jgi:hypothetical protein